MAQERSAIGTALDDDELLDASTAEEEPDQLVVITARIEETRSEMTETIDAIRYRLSPATLMEEAKEAAGEKVHDAVSGAVDTVKEFAGSTAEVIKQKATAVAEAVGDAYNAAADHVAEAAHKISDKVADLRGDPHAVEGVSRYDLETQKTNIGAKIVETIKLNPIPAAIAGFGLGWLLLSMQRQSSAPVVARGIRDYDNEVPVEHLNDAAYIAPAVAYSSNFGTASNNGGSMKPEQPGIRDRVSDAAHNLGGRAADIAHTVGDKASDIAHNVGDKASGIAQDLGDKALDLKSKAGEWAGGVRDSAGQFKDKAGDAMYNFAGQTKAQAGAAVDATGKFIQDQPLVAAGIALLVGVAVAYALPSTMAENQYLGPRRDRLVDQGKDAAQNVADKVQTVANTALGKAQQSLGQTVDQAAQQIKQTIQDTKMTVIDEAHHQGLALTA